MAMFRPTYVLIVLLLLGTVVVANDVESTTDMGPPLSNMLARHLQPSRMQTRPSSQFLHRVKRNNDDSMRVPQMLQYFYHNWRQIAMAADVSNIVVGGVVAILLLTGHPFLGLMLFFVLGSLFTAVSMISWRLGLDFRLEEAKRLYPIYYVNEYKWHEVVIRELGLDTVTRKLFKWPPSAEYAMKRSDWVGNRRNDRMDAQKDENSISERNHGISSLSPSHDHIKPNSIHTGFGRNNVPWIDSVPSSKTDVIEPNRSPSAASRPRPAIVS
ncbi:hypothetical protein SeMB42_g00796 [Synchytrium endobioticum]|uniref:Uncharacterized protein n=1 Tax=Synchytrium endobioticum TaxID=286115 RepID=A0A507DNW0_9FUNG|nr:hypothetical protein SeMB42_g00796 [Synchytrium endobioticum]